MANQFGQFAGAAAEAFTRTMALGNESKRRDELAKLQAKLVEAQLKSGEMVVDAQTTLADIMTGSVGPIETIGEAVPAQGGRQAVPEFDFTGEEPLSLVDMLTGTDPRSKQGQQAALQSGVLKGGDILDFQSERDRLAAIPDIGQLMGNLTPDENGNIPFILGGVTLDPVRGPVQSFVRNPEYNTSQQEDFSRLTLSQMTTDALEAVDIEALQAGSFVESGFPFGEEAKTGQSAIATIGGALGFDTEKQRERVAKRDRLDKLYGLILNTRLERLMEKDKNLSITQIQQQMEISPSTEKRAEANILLLADFLQEQLNITDIEGPTVSATDRKKVVDFIRKARSGELLQSQATPVVDVPEIAKMSLDQLEALDIENFTLDQIKAVRDRVSALK